MGVLEGDISHMSLLLLQTEPSSHTLKCPSLALHFAVQLCPTSEITSCIINHNLQPTNAHNSAKVTTLQHTSAYMFLASLAYHQGGHSCTKQSFYIRYLQQSCRKPTQYKIYVIDGVVH